MLKEFKEVKKELDAAQERVDKIMNVAAENHMKAIAELASKATHEEMNAFMNADEEVVSDLEKAIAFAEYMKAHDEGPKAKVIILGP